ncbi:MAG: TIGR02450 family Trp-rich protein, partial [Vulcanococcus sp.]
MKWPQQWTAQANVLGQTRGYRHFRVLGESGKGKERRLALEAVLNRAFRLEVPLVQLRDRSLWQPGWQSLSRPASMQIIPAIDLLDGHCVRLHQGDYGQVTRFNDDPVAQALDWQRQGAQRLHLVDLDGAKSGQPINDQAVKAITSALSIPVQLGGTADTAAQ